MGADAIALVARRMSTVIPPPTTAIARRQQRKIFIRLMMLFPVSVVKPGG
jgi:hypothetical protein